MDRYCPNSLLHFVRYMGRISLPLYCCPLFSNKYWISYFAMVKNKYYAWFYWKKSILRSSDGPSLIIIQVIFQFGAMGQRTLSTLLTISVFLLDKMLQIICHNFGIRKPKQIFSFFISSNFRLFTVMPMSTSFRASSILKLLKMKKTIWVFLFQKYDFRSISLDNFIKHKPLISEEGSVYVMELLAFDGKFL